jgi:hypothetical protein
MIPQREVAPLRTRVDPNDPKDTQQVHALQDVIASSSRRALAVLKCRIGISQPEKVRDVRLQLNNHDDTGQEPRAQAAPTISSNV